MAHFQILVYFIFLSDGGAPKRRGAQGNLPLYPSPFRRAWTGQLSSVESVTVNEALVDQR